MSVWLLGGAPMISAGVIVGEGGEEPPLQPPAQMAKPSLATGHQQIIATLAAQPNLNGLPLIAYDLRYSTDQATWTEVQGVTSPHTIPGLANGTTYFVQTTARTDGGVNWSASESAIPPLPDVTVPGQMAAPLLTPGDGEIIVDLAENTPNGGAAISSEDVRHGAAASGVEPASWTTVTGVSDPHTISSLTNGQSRGVQTRAVNSAGAGSWSPTRWATPVAVVVDPGIQPADVTVSSWAALTSLLTSWNGNWNGTIPVGKTATSPRYIDLTSGSYGGGTISSRVFPAQVHIRSQNKVALGASFTSVRLLNCQRIVLDYIKTDLTGGSLNGGWGLKFENSPNCRVSNSYILGNPDFQHLDEYANAYGLWVQSSANFLGFDNIIDSWPVGHYILGSANSTTRDSLFRRMKGDDMKMGGMVGFQFLRNWGSVSKEKFAPSDHVDFFQHQGTDGARDCLAEGNIFYQLTNSNGKSIQGLFWDDGPMVNVTNRHNVGVCLNYCVKGVGNFNGGSGSSGNVAVFNTSLRPSDNTNPVLIQSIVTNNSAGGGLTDDNIVAAQTGTNGGAGPNGIAIPIGTSPTNKNYSGQLLYYTGPLTHGVPGVASPMERLMPIEGTRAHWDHSDYTGGALRLKHVYEDGIHPGNSTNPVLVQLWRHDYDPTGFVTS